MNKLFLLFCVLSGTLTAQTLNFKPGFYKAVNAGEPAIIQVVNDDEINNEDQGNVYIAKGNELIFYRQNKEKNRYENQFEGDVVEVAIFYDLTEFQLTLKHFYTGENVNYVFIGTDVETEMIENDAVESEEFIDDYELMDESMFPEMPSDPFIVEHPQHIDNAEYFSPNKLAKLPVELTFWDYKSVSRLYEIFENADVIPEATKQQIIAVVDVMNDQMQVRTCYVIYNEQKQTHDCYEINNKLAFRLKFTNNWMYVDFLELQSNAIIGRMNQLTMESEEFTPKGIHLFGNYTILETEQPITLLTDREAGTSQLLFTASPHGQSFNFNLNSVDEYVCTAVNGKSYYSFSFDENKAGQITLKDLVSGKVFHARYNFGDE